MSSPQAPSFLLWWIDALYRGRRGVCSKERSIIIRIAFKSRLLYILSLNEKNILPTEKIMQYPVPHLTMSHITARIPLIQYKIATYQLQYTKATQDNTCFVLSDLVICATPSGSRGNTRKTLLPALSQAGSTTHWTVEDSTSSENNNMRPHLDHLPESLLHMRLYNVV
jgi:hypothetical protein